MTRASHPLHFAIVVCIRAFAASAANLAGGLATVITLLMLMQLLRLLLLLGFAPTLNAALAAGFAAAPAAALLHRSG